MRTRRHEHVVTGLDGPLGGGGGSWRRTPWTPPSSVHDVDYVLEGETPQRSVPRTRAMASSDPHHVP